MAGGFLALVAGVSGAESLPPPAAGPESARFRGWIQEMKGQGRGPFAGVRWYCADGAVLEPVAFACDARGGGAQHGRWSERTLQIRAAGYPIANVLAQLTPDAVIGPDADPDFLEILLLEKFLVAADDGWILREAQFYRGAFQDYNERDSAAAILRALLAQPEPLPFAVLREAARLLPHGAETAAITKLRGLATTLAGLDPQFETLRSKIHSMPDAADAERVRAYAMAPRRAPALQADFAALAAMIDGVNDRATLPATLRTLARRVPAPGLKERLATLASGLDNARDAESQFRLGTEVLVLIRQRLPGMGAPDLRLAALDASLGAETAVFTASRDVLQALPTASRARRLAWLGIAARSVHGLGLLNGRELAEIEQAIARLGQGKVRLESYRAELQALDRAAAWPGRRLAHHFGNAIDRLTPIEPLAANYIADRLRGSAMLFYSNVLASLAQDADRLSGMRHSLFGQPGAGLRRVNPGMARGVLRTAADLAHGDTGSAKAIYLVAETTADLPAVAGILTAAEGNALSHVQLLARNLGIPNVVVSPSLLPALEAWRGRSIVVAASSGGVVRIEADGPAWAALLGARQGVAAQAIHADLARLDLTHRTFVPTTRLRAADSGRTVGPKAAQVGELTHHFPAHVPLGLAIPFGAYRAVLDRPVAPGKISMFEWLRAEYAGLAVRRELDPAYYAQRMPALLAFVRRWLKGAELGGEFRETLRNDMHDLFGMEGTYGVFVRSDTNVEDLPGFTGAGLNLTVPNVVGVDAVISAIQQVWASPSTERAFGWRQGLMDLPEHVYPSVLLHRSVAADKSGVMVTANLDTGVRDEITVVTNTGVGGGVDGQAAETLAISLRTGAVRLLASATARNKRVLAVEGGARVVASDAPEFVLSPAEIRQLLEFVRALPMDYPGLRDERGQPAPADIEFAFAAGHLVLLQIRPYVQNVQVSQNRYLADLDAGLRQTGDRRLDLDAAPETPS